MFAFGKNWSDFSSTIDEAKIAMAQVGLLRLFPNNELAGKPFFDIGCGSGLSMVAASRLGASRVTGIDIDADSVATSRTVLRTFAPDCPASVEQKSVFDLIPAGGTFPIVHSWGVLHHTGDMWKAIETAAAMVAPGGMLAVALYRKTPLCGAWKAEKMVYSNAPSFVQTAIRGAYKGAFLAGMLAAGRNPKSYIANYKTRGMSWSHDVHDWLGGYPYQSTEPSEVMPFLQSRGMRVDQIDADRPSLGLFGTYCNEFVAHKA